MMLASLSGSKLGGSRLLRQRSSIQCNAILTQFTYYYENNQTNTRHLSAKAKKGKKAKKTSVSTDGGGADTRNRITDILIRAFDAKPRTPPEPSEEEKQRRIKIGRDYGIFMFQRQNAINHDLACKIRMKRQAIKMLPRGSWLKEEALKIDMTEETLPPFYRPLLTYTPPIPGYNPSDFIAKED
mmetsp:Transcript_19285/g.27132  ORF Transcript_19285/g.27132 Transcript_19285/m.27132 type:complete len:184 (-) Transcript_19285:62-613(-)